MCDICRDILGSCVRRHLAKDCCLNKAKYCTLCALYGHTFNECSKVFPDIEYIEQLIPPCYIKELNINTNTVLSGRTVHKYLTNERPQFMEDLIPQYFRNQYNISSETPIKGTKYELTPMKPTIDVIDNPKAIRDLLKAYGQMPKKDNRNKDKYKMNLEKFAKKMGYNIVYHESDKKDDSSIEYG